MDKIFFLYANINWKEKIKYFHLRPRLSKSNLNIFQLDENKLSIEDYSIYNNNWKR